MRRNHRKCQRCGRKRRQPVEVETPAGKRVLCVECRNRSLFEVKRVVKVLVNAD